MKHIATTRERQMTTATRSRACSRAVPLGPQGGELPLSFLTRRVDAVQAVEGVATDAAALVIGRDQSFVAGSHLLE